MKINPNNLFKESSKCPSVEYVYDMDLYLSDDETVNDTVEIDYEYSYEVEVSIKIHFVGKIRCKQLFL